MDSHTNNTVPRNIRVNLCTTATTELIMKTISAFQSENTFLHSKLKSNNWYKVVGQNKMNIERKKLFKVNMMTDSKTKKFSRKLASYI